MRSCPEPVQPLQACPGEACPAEPEQRPCDRGKQQGGNGQHRDARGQRQQRRGDREQGCDIEHPRHRRRDGRIRDRDAGTGAEDGSQHLAGLHRQRVVGEQRGVEDREQAPDRDAAAGASEQRTPRECPQGEGRRVATDEQREQPGAARDLLDAIAQQGAVGCPEDHDCRGGREHGCAEPTQPAAPRAGQRRGPRNLLYSVGCAHHEPERCSLVRAEWFREVIRTVTMHSHRLLPKCRLT